MILKPCPFCQKDIPRSIVVCPYCHKDEKGLSAEAESPKQAVGEDKFFNEDLSDLASTDPFIRDQAVVRMGQKGFGVVQALIDVLSDHAKPGLAGVAKSLGRIADRRAIPVLTVAAQMGDDELRTAAVWALSQYREPEILPVLLKESERTHPAIQSYLAFILGSFQDPRILPALARLSQHASREVAYQAVYSLGELGEVAAAKPLRNALRRRDPVVHTVAMASLDRLGLSRVSNSRWTVIAFLFAGFVTAVALAFWTLHK